jgi:hypothetical protein
VVFANIIESIAAREGGNTQKRMRVSEWMIKRPEESRPNLAKMGGISFWH